MPKDEVASWSSVLETWSSAWAEFRMLLAETLLWTVVRITPANHPHGLRLLEFILEYATETAEPPQDSR